MSPSTPPTSSPQETLHLIPPSPVTAFEPLKPLSPSSAVSTLIWIGGLGDTALSVRYPLALAQALPGTWSLATATLSSSGIQWGTRSIAQDAEEIASIVKFFRSKRPEGKVVLMGHSTGCQDCLEYAIKSSSSAGAGDGGYPKVEAIILQAPVSDREALDHIMDSGEKAEADSAARKMCEQGEGDEVMPSSLTRGIFPRVPVSARRWVDVSCHGGRDDFFSSDFGEEALGDSFGKGFAVAGGAESAGKGNGKMALLVLESERDEAVPPNLNKWEVVERWFGVVKKVGGSVDEVNSGVVRGATHNLNGNPEEVVKDLVDRVVGFVGRLDRGEL